jgi:hypothetical protein
MPGVLVLACSFVLTAPEMPDRRIRSVDPRIVGLIEKGLSGSLTFERLVAAPAPKSFAAEVLEAAIFLAGPSVAGLPIVLASSPPVASSKGVEAWTAYGDDGKGTRIFVYIGSGVFRCASQLPSGAQCPLRLASAIVHEAWHFRNGPNEAAAYDAQLTFLFLHGGSTEQISSVRVSRDRMLAAERKKIQAAKRQ